MKDKEKYKKVIFELIDKNFSKLKRRKIFLICSKYQIGNTSAAVYPFGFFDCIVVFPISKNHSINSLKGLLAHELSHCELIISMSFFKKVSFAFSWLFTKKGKAKFETDADKNVIKKGYGKEFLEFVKEREKKEGKEYLKRRSKRGYLSSKQIRNYLKR